MKKINYLEILKKAWNLTWHNKFLWWFGFFIALASGGGSLNSSIDRQDLEKISGEPIGQKALDYLAHNYFLAGSLIAFFLVIFVTLVILSIIARGGLIKSIEIISKGEAGSGVKSGFREGRKYFWRLFSIGFSLRLFLLAILFILAIPVIFLFYNQAFWIGGILAFCAFLIFIPLAITAVFTETYAQIYVVTGDISFWEAIEDGYAIFRKNIGASLIQSFIFLILGIIFGIGFIFALIPLVIIFLVIGFLLYIIFKSTGIWITVGLGTLTLLILSLFLKSIYEAFSQAVWIFFFHSIANPAVSETVTEEVIEMGPAPAPDTAS